VLGVLLVSFVLVGAVTCFTDTVLIVFLLLSVLAEVFLYCVGC
jgi:hypothetical protein